jgi:hypothetical protein
MIEPTTPELKIFEFADVEKLLVLTELIANLGPITEPSDNFIAVTEPSEGT